MVLDWIDRCAPRRVQRFPLGQLFCGFCVSDLPLFQFGTTHSLDHDDEDDEDEPEPTALTFTTHC